MADQPGAVLHDGSTIAVTVQGDGPAILLPVSPATHTAAEAESLRQWGADPDLGPNLMTGLAPTNRVIAADYEAHRMANPAPATLTPDNIAAVSWPLPIPPALKILPTTAIRGSRSAACSWLSVRTGSRRWPWAASRRSRVLTGACWQSPGQRTLSP
ncbi:hypothetical protein [[Micrococcus luteus] ATCC 49442]|uniref:hypothetical protein n=1 Tax=[Micrococcus luteus] ATCC 49442 TaxID=2698727 RepID=UPI001FCB05AA|nr:hypothetical protein [[Micrococcus luteus] ATCC 49442]